MARECPHIPITTLIYLPASVPVYSNLSSITMERMSGTLWVCTRSQLLLTYSRHYYRNIPLSLLQQAFSSLLDCLFLLDCCYQYARVKNIEESEILPYLQDTSQPVTILWLLAEAMRLLGKKQRTLFITDSSSSSQRFSILLCGSLSPNTHVVM